MNINHDNEYFLTFCFIFAVQNVQKCIAIVARYLPKPVVLCRSNIAVALQTVVRAIVQKKSVNINSPHFNGHFPGEPGLAGFIGDKDDGSGGDNWS